MYNSDFYHMVWINTPNRYQAKIIFKPFYSCFHSLFSLTFPFPKPSIATMTIDMRRFLGIKKFHSLLSSSRRVKSHLLFRECILQEPLLGTWNALLATAVGKAFRSHSLCQKRLVFGIFMNGKMEYFYISKTDEVVIKSYTHGKSKLLSWKLPLFNILWIIELKYIQIFVSCTKHQTKRKRTVFAILKHSSITSYNGKFDPILIRITVTCNTF